VLARPDFQVQRAIDIGQNSAFAQLQTIMKTANENTLVSADNDTQRPYTANWEPKSKRMLVNSILNNHSIHDKKTKLRNHKKVKANHGAYQKICFPVSKRG
jgi:hypothetical protein